jgi:hypothetical protein
MDKEDMIELIQEYSFGDNEMCIKDCNDCVYLEECYSKAVDKCNSEFAKSINYGGYSSEEEFWEMLMN